MEIKKGDRLMFKKTGTENLVVKCDEDYVTLKAEHSKMTYEITREHLEDDFIKLEAK